MWKAAIFFATNIFIEIKVHKVVNTNIVLWKQPVVIYNLKQTEVNAIIRFIILVELPL